MSDSEDDFMSDKFLVATEAPTKTHSQKRAADQLKAQRRGQAKNQPKLAQLEKERRVEGLSRSLFDSAPSGSAEASGSGVEMSAGGSKAMAMMQKMGWKVGEGLGRQRSPSPPRGEKRGQIDDEEDDEDRPRGGIGSRSAPAPNKQPRIEPIRVSLWAGRKGLSARSPSPPPLPASSGRNVDHLDPEKLRRLEEETEGYREWNRRQFGNKDLEKKAYKAREMLVGFDGDKGIKFHPLHVLPSDPLGTLPRPLLILIYPSQALALSPSPPPPSRLTRSPSPVPLHAAREKTMTAAEKVREQMRRDMLSSLDEDEDPIMKRKRELGLLGTKNEASDVVKGLEGEGQGIHWQDQVSGTKRVLSMDTETYFTYLLSQLRNEHFFCFWCGYKYSGFDEMEGRGGCPGLNEDDH